MNILPIIFITIIFALLSLFLSYKNIICNNECYDNKKIKYIITFNILILIINIYNLLNYKYNVTLYLLLLITLINIGLSITFLKDVDRTNYKSSNDAILDIINMLDPNKNNTYLNTITNYWYLLNIFVYLINTIFVCTLIVDIMNL